MKNYKAIAVQGGRIRTTEQFIAKATQVHQGKYDYSESEYVSSKTKIKIVCKDHGSFEQLVGNHLKGAGCPQCAMASRISKIAKTLDGFIRQASEIHDNKYDYSHSVYVNDRTKIKIGCPCHGFFEQSPNDHLRGHGCSKCGGSSRLSQEDFIWKSRQCHGDRYDYSQSVYVNTSTKVKIGCRTHGVFEQIAKDHFSGHGCPACTDNKRLSKDDFVAKSRLVHGDKYDYSAVICGKNNKEKVKILCLEHGAFIQKMNSHLTGQGCPSCTTYGFDPSKPGLLYFLKFEKPFASFWKIGITNRTRRERFRGDFDFVTSQYLWEFDKGSDAYQIEQSVLREFRKYRFDDSFLFSLLEVAGDTECFAPTMPHKKVIAFVESQIRTLREAIAA